MPNDATDIRGDLLAVLLSKVEQDQYPSSTMMDLVEELMNADEQAAYAHVLLDKIQADNFPSLDMVRRLRDLT